MDDLVPPCRFLICLTHGFLPAAAVRLEPDPRNIAPREALCLVSNRPPRISRLPGMYDDLCSILILCLCTSECLRSNNPLCPSCVRSPVTSLFYRLPHLRLWPGAAPPHPVGRGEAIVLQSALDEALPPGVIMAKYRPDAPLLSAVGSKAQVRFY